MYALLIAKAHAPPMLGDGPDQIILFVKPIIYTASFSFWASETCLNAMFSLTSSGFIRSQPLARAFRELAAVETVDSLYPCFFSQKLCSRMLTIC
jgi:hypothetical protein